MGALSAGADGLRSAEDAITFVGRLRDLERAAETVPGPMPRSPDSMSADERSATMERMAENEGGAAEPRALRLRYAATCKTCEVGVPKGARAWWSSKDKTIRCEACHAGADAAEASDESSVLPDGDATPTSIAAAADLTADGSGDRDDEGLDS